MVLTWIMEWAETLFQYALAEFGLGRCHGVNRNCK